jgi:hypothetical protein
VFRGSLRHGTSLNARIGNGVKEIIAIKVILSSGSAKVVFLEGEKGDDTVLLGDPIALYKSCVSTISLPEDEDEKERYWTLLRVADGPGAVGW